MLKAEMDKQKVALAVAMDNELDSLSDVLCTALYKAMETETSEDCNYAVDLVIDERGYTVDDLLKSLFVYKASVELHILLKEEAFA